MDNSLIIFAGIVACCLATMPFAARGVHLIFKDIFKYKDYKKHEEVEKEVDKKKDELKETLDSGDLSDLLNAAKELGDKKKKDKKKQ